MIGELNNTQYKKIANSLVLIILLFYTLENSFVAKHIGGTLFAYGVKPLFYILIAMIMTWKIPKVRLCGKWLHQSTVYTWAFNCGVIYIVANILGGIIQGFGKSPYNLTPLGILTNIWTVSSVLIGREMIRAYVINSHKGIKSKIVFGVVVLIMTFTNIRLAEIKGLSDLEAWTIFMAEKLMPELCHNLLATYLVMYAGPLASILYLGMIEAFMWLSPILPNINWLGKGVIGMLIPIFCLVYIHTQYLKLTKKTKMYKEKQEKLIEWVPFTLITISFIWFVAGVFPIYPSAIATGSMQPLIDPGDVILLEKIKDMEDVKHLKVGDVIQFKRGEILITHRIIEVVEEQNGFVFRTKGDNNSVEDRQVVIPENLKGILKGIVPKVGYLTILLKSQDLSSLEEIEF